MATSNKRRSPWRFVWAIAGVAMAATLALSKPGTTWAADVVAAYRPALPGLPDDVAWKSASVAVVPLVVQDMVEPRLLEASTLEVRVQAMTDGTRLTFRLEWADASTDDVNGVSAFSDGCAVQLPADVAADVPAPQMGEAGKTVEIAYWRAAWQAMVDGREDSIRALHPGAVVDVYPFDAPSLEQGSDRQVAMAKRYAPARNLGNDLAGPRTVPVQDLVAEGPGTIRPAAATTSTGAGKRTANGWLVQITRALPKSSGSRSQVAFAVWQGAHGEVGARKMRSVWVPLALEAAR
jgi:DMSO reductase family type II enzyme heme b subunit